jgi:hypothetical protein
MAGEIHGNHRIAAPPLGRDAAAQARRDAA